MLNVPPATITSRPARTVWSAGGRPGVAVGDRRPVELAPLDILDQRQSRAKVRI